MPTITAGSRSIGMAAGLSAPRARPLLQDAAQRRLVFYEEGRGIRGRKPGALELVVVEVLLPGRALGHALEHVLVEGDGLGGDSWRRDETACLHNVGDGEAGLGQRRRVGEARQACTGYLREHAHAARAHLFAGLARLSDHDVHMPAQHGGNTLATAREGDE